MPYLMLRPLLLRSHSLTDDDDEGLRDGGDAVSSIPTQEELTHLEAHSNPLPGA